MKMPSTRYQLLNISLFGTAILLMIRIRKKSKSIKPRDGYLGLIGNTPLIQIKSLSTETGCDILAKVEYLNPGGTGKDRLAASMIEHAVKSGSLKPGGTVVEGTSGSTGISLASICNAKGYKCIIVMPDDQAKEKVELLKILGAEVIQVKTSSIANPDHYVNIARKIANDITGAVFMDQFESEANFLVHYEKTGPEIYEQTGGKIDGFVMGSGTGGTISGVSSYLKEKCKFSKKVPKIFLVDPTGSSLLNRVKFGLCYATQQAEHNIRKHRYDTIAEGIGLDRITANFEKALIDDAFLVTDQEAVYMAHYLLRHEGLFVGCSTAMNCVGSVKAAKQMGLNQLIVTLLCDHGSRYTSRFWNREFIENCGLKWPSENELENLWFVK